MAILGFKSSRGTTYGPFGAGGGTRFSVDGQVLGFFGALKDGALSGIVVWYTPTVPGSLLFPTNLEMTPAYGAVVNVWTWDDTPDMGGAHHPFTSLFWLAGVPFPSCL